MDNSLIILRLMGLLHFLNITFCIYWGKFLIHCKDKLKVAGQVEILGQAVLSLKMRSYLVFHTYARLVEFSRHYLLFGLFFCPVKLNGLFQKA